MKNILIIILLLNTFTVNSQSLDTGISDNSRTLIIVVIVNIVLTILSLIFHYVQTKNSYKIEAKKLLVTERMKAHKELYSLVMTGTKHNVYQDNSRCYEIFESLAKYKEWSERIWTFVDCNSVYLTKDVLKGYAELFRKRDEICTYAQNDAMLQYIGKQQFIEISKIYSNIFNATGKFFEKEMHQDYKFTNILELN